MAASSTASGVSENVPTVCPSSNNDLDAISLARECAFSPAIAVLTSYDVEAICEKDNVSFCELLLPFTQLTNEAVVKDPNNQNILIKNLRLDFRDLRRDGYLSNAALPVALEELMTQYPSTATANSTAESDTTGLKENCVVDTNTPWYDAYTRQFLRLLDPPDYEFSRHYLACILVVSTAHDDPLDQFNRLSQSQHALQHQQHNVASSVQLPKHAATPKWFSPNTFKYHLLVHDVASGDDRKAESVYQGMKMNYGAHACHLLRMNSASSGATSNVSSEIWAPFLRYRLRHFNNLHVHEDEKAVLNENNNAEAQNGGAPLTTIVNGDMVLVGAEQAEKANDGTTIPHPLSCNDLDKLGDQNDVAADKEERMQPTAYGQCLMQSDIDRIKVFVQEFSVRGLLPFVERQLRLLNEQVVARRGLHKTFLSFTKNLWGKTSTSGSTPNLQNMAISSSSSGSFGYASASSTSLSSPEKTSSEGVASVPTITYAYESAEMQTRRLADLAALFQNYELAYQLYHSLKKEFTTAQAWIHSASAMEFASLCIFLAGPTQSRPYPSHYMDQAINTYLVVPGSSLLSARASMYSTAVLCAIGDYGQAAAQYIRLSSGDDLRSALFLEQAALCFIRAGLKRKAALHLILAGHRYGKASNRQHTTRCYKAALKSYYGKGWRYALDHIFATLGEEAPGSCAENVSAILNRKQPPDSHKSHKTGLWLPKSVHMSPNTTATEAPDNGRQEKLVSISDAINCTLVFQPMLEHDFVAKGLCRVVIGLDIVYANDVEELLIKAYSGVMASSPGEFQHFYRSYPLLLWSSSCRRVHLPPDGPVSENGLYRHRLDLLAVIPVPGIYDASSLAISSRRKDSSHWEDLPLLHSQFITVIQSPRMNYSKPDASESIA